MQSRSLNSLILLSPLLLLAEEEWLLLCNKEKSPYVKEDPQAEEVRVCTLTGL
jgi:hypothetical protein